MLVVELLADLGRARHVAADALLDHALDHAAHERHARRLEDLEVDRREQRRLLALDGSGGAAAAVGLGRRRRQHVAEVVGRVRRPVEQRADGGGGIRALRQVGHRRAERGDVGQPLARDGDEARPAAGRPEPAHQHRAVRRRPAGRGRRGCADRAARCRRMACGWAGDRVRCELAVVVPETYDDLHERSIRRRSPDRGGRVAARAASALAGRRRSRSTCSKASSSSTRSCRPRRRCRRATA